MGKGKVALICCVLIIITLFFIMVYLMTTIDPLPLPPLERQNIPDNTLAEDEQNFARRYKNMFYGEGPFSETGRYGLEKVDMGQMIFYRPINGPLPTYNKNGNRTRAVKFSPRNVVPPFWPRSTKPIKTNTTMNEEVIPIWSSGALITGSPLAQNVNITLGENFYFHYDIVQKPKDTYGMNKFNLKPMKRRAANNYKNISQDVGPIILKILDNNGRPRFEIKFGSGNQSQNDDLNIFKSHAQENTEPVKDTIITIMTNNSVVIDEFENNFISAKDLSGTTNITDTLSSIILAPARYSGQETNIRDVGEGVLQIDIKNNNTVKTPSDENILLKLNETNLLNNIIGNSSYYDIVNSNTIIISNDTSRMDLDIKNNNAVEAPLDEDITLKELIINKTEPLNNKKANRTYFDTVNSDNMIMLNDIGNMDMIINNSNPLEAPLDEDIDINDLIVNKTEPLMKGNSSFFDIGNSNNMIILNDSRTMGINIKKNIVTEAPLDENIALKILNGNLMKPQIMTSNSSYFDIVNSNNVNMLQNTKTIDMNIKNNKTVKTPLSENIALQELIVNKIEYHNNMASDNNFDIRKSDNITESVEKRIIDAAENITEFNVISNTRIRNDTIFSKEEINNITIVT